MTSAAHGPFVRAALLCERVDTDGDGRLSAIGIVHEGTVVAEPSRLVLLLMLVRGDAPAGDHRVRLSIDGPAGNLVSRKEILVTIEDGGPEQASSLVLDLVFAPVVPGVYWFAAGWGDEPRPLTRVPYTAHAPPPAAASIEAAGAR